MGNYNFDEIINRKGTYSSKWDNVGARVGNSEAIPMWVADMDFRSPEPVIEAIRRRVDLGIFGYPFLHDDFYQAVCLWMLKRHGWKVDPSSVAYVSSVIPAMYAAVQALTQPGDEVLILRPVYYPFTHAIEESGRLVCNCPLVFSEDGYHIDFDRLEKCAAREKVKLMLLCNPHNPVGRVFSKEELQRIGRICLRYGIYIFSDEIHSDIVFASNIHIPIASLSKEISDVTVTAVSPSKTFNLAGLRTAAIIAENPTLLSRMKSQFDRNKCALVSAFGLDGCIAAYREGEEYLRELLDYLQGNIQFLDSFLQDNIPKIHLIKPEGTYLMWLDCRELGLDNDQLDQFFIFKAKVAVDKGYWFGEEGSGFMRMNIACPRDIIKEALENLMAVYRTTECVF